MSAHRVVVERERAVARLLGLDVRAVLLLGPLTEGLVQVLEHRRVLARAGGACLVEQAEHADRPLGNQVDDVLVVLVRDEVPLDALLDVDLLLELEDVLDEEVVQRLVGEVDAQLREGVDAKVLEAEDVEHSDAVVRVADGDVLVDHVHGPAAPIERQAVR
jgi:hypothetical protein